MSKITTSAVRGYVLFSLAQRSDDIFSLSLILTPYTVCPVVNTSHMTFTSSPVDLKVGLKKFALIRHIGLKW